MIRLYNSLGRQVQDFKPIKANEVKLYSCGPTVYDFVQLGNLRAFVFVDTLRRALSFNGYSVKHVMNITDVGHLVSDMDEGEDKLEKGAQREGKSVWQVAEFYEKAFIKDMAALNILPPNGYTKDDGPYARATKFINEQIQIIELLLEKGFAYKTADAIYFDVTKLPDYGKLSGQKLEDKEVGARTEVVTDSNKHHPQDFALWFFLVGRFKNHTMHWNSPWGAGFPGWHIECSAIIYATLGETIDIHTGGVDHIGTHHTNEIAQSEAAFGTNLANFWLHNEFVMVEGQKMSKSLNNFYSLKDVTDRGYDPLALRLLFLQSHYRSQLNFTWSGLDAATENLHGINAWADLLFQPDAKAELGRVDEENLEQGIARAIDEDLNTAKALALLNDKLDAGRPSKSLLEKLDAIFGLKLANREDVSPEVKKIITERSIARDSNDWQKADSYREQLQEKGIEVKDTKAGPIWSRI